MWLNRETYNQLNKDLAEAKADAIKWMARFVEMEIRKNYYKEEFTKVSALLDESIDQRSRLVTQLSLEIDRQKRLNRMLDEAQDQIKKLTKNKKGEK